MQIVQVPQEDKKQRPPISHLDPGQPKRRKVEEPKDAASNKRDQKYVKKIMDQEPLYEQKLDKVSKDGI